MKKICLLILLCTFGLKICFAQQGKNGAETISVNNTVVNDYTVLTGDAAVGSTSITVSSSASFSTGDLVLIIQMQGASLYTGATDSTWGSVSSYNNCGLFETDQVTDVPGSTTINLQCPLKNTYNASGNVQVIRVPRYTSLTINAGDTLTCAAWFGSGVATGGIVVVEVSGNTIINGAINTSGYGFRGGALINVSNISPFTVTHSFVSMNLDSGVEKGESIAGYETGYNTFGGGDARGAAANGGGGGDLWNAGGGGGANAGNINSWTGNGNPDITTNPTYYTDAWNTEYPGFANSTSSGGGRGGYTSASNQVNPTLYGPGNAAWGGTDRNNVGGKGGRPLDYSTGRIFFGGGGGSGDEDNNSGGGGKGGGIIYIISYGNVSGSGSVLSNGASGQNALCYNGSGDPPGGGGGGGAVVINSTGAISTISLFANGGTGGSQIFYNPGNESEGGAGGGGGGYIATTNGGLTAQVNGGANGTTNSLGVESFFPNGGTAGGNGIDTTIAPICLLQLSPITGDTMVCSGLSYTYSVTPSACPNFTYTWTLPAGWTGNSTTNSITATAGTSSGTIQVAASNGSCPLDTTLAVTVYPAPVNPNFPKDSSICGAVNLPLSAGSTGFMYLWSTGDTTSAITVTDTGTYWLQVSNACDTLVDSITILQLNKPTVFIGNDTSYCGSFTRVLNAGDSGVTYKWSTGDTTKTIIVNTYGNYWVTVSNRCGQATDTIKITSCEGGYILANAFTPGSENANSLIGLLKTGNGTTTLQYFRIYNRWGQLIFYTNDDQAAWDGRFNGTPEPIGVCIYVVNYDDSFGVNKLLKGNITLLR